MSNLSFNIRNITFKNPVFASSGCFAYGLEFLRHIDINLLGGIFLKGLSLEEKKGNPAPRVVETPCGLLNSVGLENIGIKNFLDEKLPILRKFQTKIFLNIFGKKIEDYVKLCQIIEEYPEITGIELNVSCPNIKDGGSFFGHDEKTLENLIKQTRNHTTKLLLVKLPPSINNIANLAKISEENGADAISLINTIPAMSICIKEKKALLGNITGGLSGPAIKPIALKMLLDASNVVQIPIIGMGGIVDYKDALEFFIVGATAVQIGTSNLIDPVLSLKIINNLKKYLEKNKIDNIQKIVKTLKI